QDARVWLFVVSLQEEACAAYAYCNLHGFWKTEI
ncbi:MAG: class II SORL domain-containing protein, partial [Lachnospiraceae bacterium]|nr:class II SORL domain-containing protein [Lachnospiraceae bacterium]